MSVVRRRDGLPSGLEHIQVPRRTRSTSAPTDDQVPMQKRRTSLHPPPIAEVMSPTPNPDTQGPPDVGGHLLLAMRLSLLVNLLLFLAKTYSALVSHSLSVGASAGESFLDLASEVIVVIAERRSKIYDSQRYPVGRSKLEPIGIILCASLMGMAALQLILESVSQLVGGVNDTSLLKHVVFDSFTISLLALNIIAKLMLWIYCTAFAKYSPTLFTLATDHRNDVLSNIVALIAAVLAWKWSQAWAADPIGAILMSIYICYNWFSIGNEQIEMIVGRAANPEFIDQIRELTSNFHSQLVPDIIRAYHYGAKYLVEVEVLLPAEMSVRDSHTIAHSLQKSIELLPTVERAFIHVDCESRAGIDRHQRSPFVDYTSASPTSPSQYSPQLSSTPR